MAAASKEARLILRLVDQVTAPARAVNTALRGVVTTMNAVRNTVLLPAQGLNNLSRDMRQQVTNLNAVSGAVSIGLGVAGKAVYDYEKAGNKMQAFGLITDESRKKLEEYSKALNKDFPFTNRQILESAQELFRAGLTYDQVMGSLRGTLDLAMAGDIGIKEASDIATNVMTAMRLPMDTMEQVSESMLRVNDALAYAATKSNTDVRLMGDTFRYVAPLAAAANMSLEEVTAISMELAKNGIKGSEAGVALRSALVRMVKPTKAMNAMLERLNLNINDFVTGSKDVTAEQVVGTLRGYGFEIGGMEKDIEAILANKTKYSSPARLVAGLTDAIVSEIGDETVRSEIAEAMTLAIAGGADKVDLIGFLTALRKKGVGIREIPQIFDIRMGARLAAVLVSDLEAAVDSVKEGYRGVGAQMAGLMMQGIVGALAGLMAALENFATTLAETGVLDTVVETFEAISSFVQELSKTNPELLEMSTYAVMALAAMAPLGLIISGVAAALSLMVNPIALVVAGLGYLAYLNFDRITDYLTGFYGALTNSLGPRTLALIEKAKGAFRSLFDAMTPSDGDRSAWGAGRSHGAATAGWIESSIVATESAVARLKAAMASMAASTEFQSGLNLLRSIGNFFSEMGGAIGRVASGTASGVREFFSAFVDGLAPGTTSKLESFVEFARTSMLSLNDAMAGMFNKLAEAYSRVDVNFDEAARKAGAFMAEIVNGVFNADYAGMAAKVKGWFDKADKMIDDFIAGLPAMRDAGIQMVQSLWDGAVAKFDELLAWVRNIPQRIKDAIGRIDLSNIITLPSFLGGGEVSAPPANDNYGGARARGGPIRAGMSYLTGERGPEIITADRNGYVTPTHALAGLGGSHTNFNNTFHFHGGATKSDAEEVLKALNRQLARSEQIAFGALEAYGE